MTVGELQAQLAQVDQNLEIVIIGCYSSTGTVEETHVAEHPDDAFKRPVRDRRQCLLLVSDICSG